MILSIKVTRWHVAKATPRRSTLGRFGKLLRVAVGAPELEDIGSVGARDSQVL